MNEDILEAVSEVTGISVDHMKSKSVIRGVVEARGLYCVVGSMAGIEKRQLGQPINKCKDTIKALTKKYSELYDTDDSVRNNVMKVLELIGNETDIESVMENPLWTEDFRIIDVSSRYSGQCFIGMIHGEPAVQDKSFYAVANEMITLKNEMP